MKALGLFSVICAVTIVGFGSPTWAADDLDSRLAELEKKNIDLKKMLRIEALEKENLALSRKISVPEAQDQKQQSAALGGKRQRDVRTSYDARAGYLPTKSEPISSARSQYF